MITFYLIHRANIMKSTLYVVQPTFRELWGSIQFTLDQLPTKYNSLL